MEQVNSMLFLIERVAIVMSVVAHPPKKPYNIILPLGYQNFCMQAARAASNKVRWLLWQRVLWLPSHAKKLYNIMSLPVFEFQEKSTVLFNIIKALWEHWKELTLNVDGN